MGKPEGTGVVVVGAGPSGLITAVRLAQLGIPHVVLDTADEPTQTSNAALVHASTIEVLDAVGIGDDLVAAGRIARRIVMVDQGKPLLRVPLTGIPSKYPFALGVPQSTTEALLLRRLEELGSAVHRRHRVDTITRSAQGDYQVAGTDGAGEPFALRARYVVGADGAHSTVRSAIGLEFPGETYPSQFVLADIALTTGSGAEDEATINLSPRGVTVLGELPSGNHRVIATVPETAEVPEHPDQPFVSALLADRGIAATVAAEPVWSSRFRVHHRVADRFRDDGVFLVGDAAHVHSPAAGQGMNTGIADGFDLATRLAAVLGGDSDAGELDRYENTRRPAALEVLRFTDGMTRMALLRNPVARAARRVAAGTLGRLPFVRRVLTMWVTGLKRSPLRGQLPPVGTRTTFEEAD